MSWAIHIPSLLRDLDSEESSYCWALTGLDVADSVLSPVVSFIEQVDQHPPTPWQLSFGC